MKFLALIPARYASTRFPGKPLVKIGNKTMIQHVYERVSSCFQHTYIATDHPLIVDNIEQFGGKYILTSPDHKSGTDRCAEALTKVETLSRQTFDVVVNIQGDEPFIVTEHLHQITELFNSPQTDIATLAKPFISDEDIFSPNIVKVVVGKNLQALYFSRSVIPFIRSAEQSTWQNSFSYLKHIGLYAYKATVLEQISKLESTPLEQAESLEQLRWLENGYCIKVGQTNVESLSIDTPEDLEKAIRMMNY